MFALALVEKADSLFLLWQPPRECPSLHDTSRDLAPILRWKNMRVCSKAASWTGYSEMFLCGRKRRLQRAIYTGRIINCGENDHPQQHWPQNCWTNSEKAKNYLILHLKHKPWNGLLHKEKRNYSGIRSRWLQSSRLITPSCSQLTIYTLLRVFALYTFLCNGSHAVWTQRHVCAGIRKPEPQTPKKRGAASLCGLIGDLLLSCAAAEGNLAERKNIGWRYSTIIQFHVHVHRGQERVLPQQH